MTDKPVTIYGIKNCDTMKKARQWLDDHRVAYVFHDYKADGIDRARLKAWTEAADWRTVLNQSSTTFRALPDAAKEGLTKAKAIALMPGYLPSTISQSTMTLTFPAGVVATATIDSGA
ncbi:MAG: ArsC/Spx/MgsR family protein, partial [Verrucomicrobiota bacterium]